jgi:starvation-inducible outer membrane lipoprotein
MNTDQHKNSTIAEKTVSPITRTMIRLLFLFFVSVCLMMSGCIAAPKPIKKTSSNVRYVTNPLHDTAKDQS